MPKDSNLEKCVLEGDSVEQKAMKKEEEKEMTDEEFNDWFIEGERRRYEEGLEQPTPFRIKVYNWRYEFKRKWIKNWFKEWWDSYRWNHGGKEKHFAPGGWYDRYSHYMKSVHECYEREWRREEAIVEKEFKVKMIYEDREMRIWLRREAVIEEEFKIILIRTKKRKKKNLVSLD